MTSSICPVSICRCFWSPCRVMKKEKPTDVMHAKGIVINENSMAHENKTAHSVHQATDIILRLTIAAYCIDFAKI